jgi:beta-carotene hydroxylase
MHVTQPSPDDLENFLILNVDRESAESTRRERRDQVKAEGVIAAKYWGGVQYRMIVTFAVFCFCWVGVVILGVNEVIPLWLGLILNSIFASTFYMPMHEATHKNIMGKATSGRWVEELIGRLSSVPTGLDFTSHRASHMRHHAFTNDPARDPDHFTEGRLSELPLKFYGMTMLYAFLPFFALIKPLRVILPHSLQEKLESREGSKAEGKAQIRFWLVSTVVLAACFTTGNGLAALCLWWIPARIQLCWLMFIFAWFPHHPANETSRYRHTRVAVFPGSGLLIRGHDYHAIHHLHPRVPHYRLKAVWNELSDELVVRGVRAEGRAKGATTSVVW